MKKFYTFFAIFLIFSSIHLFTQNVNAHDVNEPKWLFVNGEFDLVDNEIPSTSALLWTPHIIEKSFSVNESINFKADLDELKEITGQEGLSITYEIKKTYEFELKDSDQNIKSHKVGDIYIIDISKPEISLKFTATGDYFTSALAEKDGEVLEREDFTLQLGNNVEPGVIKFNNSVINKDNVNQKINRIDVVSFEIEKPNFANYNYYLDLGNTDVILVNDEKDNIVKRRFQDEKMPLYVVLRKEDKQSKVFADSYVRLYSNEDEGFKVVPPSVPLAEQSSTQNLLVVFAILSIVIIGVVLYRKRKVQKA